MKRLVRGMTLVGLVLMSGCIFVHKDLINPEVSVPENVSLATVQKAVHKAFDKYGWTVDKEDPGVTTAHLQQDQLYASVRAVYDEKHVVIEYVETRNFWHEKNPGEPERIHSRYMVWVKNIAEETEKQLNPTTTPQTH